MPRLRRVNEAGSLKDRKRGEAMSTISDTSIRETIDKELREHLCVLNLVAETLKDQIATVARIAIKALSGNKKIFFMGNGGSAADAQHLAAELVGRFKAERKALPAIALTTDTSILTALANDYGYESVFSRQITALANSGDVVIGISTSGQSPNVVKGIQTAKDMGCKTIGFTGRDGGEVAKLVDVSLIVPSTETSRIQEAHITIGHILCGLIEQAIVTR